VPDDTQVYSVRASVREIFVREDAVLIHATEDMYVQVVRRRLSDSLS
jgi:hypothetical protein